MLRDHVRIDVLGGAEKWDLHPTQTVPAWQTLPQLPQFVLSVTRLVQKHLQGVLPAPQPRVQIPPLQTNCNP
jgi:hypothetical protein